MNVLRQINVSAIPRNPWWVVLRNGRRSRLFQRLNNEKSYKRKTLTITWINSTINLNFFKGHRLLKKAILELLVALFPAGNSLTLLASLDRTLDKKKFRNVKVNLKKTHVGDVDLSLLPFPDLFVLSTFSLTRGLLWLGDSSSSYFRFFDLSF